MEHLLTPSRASLHGQFSRELEPVLEIDPGDRVRFTTLDVAWGQRPFDEPDRRFPFEDCERDRGPALHGPVGIRGARPGQVLEITIDSVQPGPWGWSLAGGPGFLQTALNADLGVGELAPERLLFTIGEEARDQYGRRFALRPFLGIIGMPADEPGWQNGFHPRATGGNMDCPALVEGSRLYLPVAVPGGLVSVGDGHALQGEGEVGGTGLECPMDASLSFRLLDWPAPPGPWVRTAEGWWTLGFGESLDQAARLALNSMLDLLLRLHGLERSQALALASLVVDLRVTQMVNGVLGAHAILRDSLMPVAGEVEL